MEIKHTHPPCPSEEVHKTQLKEIRRNCLALLRAQQKKTDKESA